MGGCAVIDRISEPGIYEIEEDAYHADPVVKPSLSSSIAKVLLRATPAHAQIQHPRLNPTYVSEKRSVFDIGSAVHCLVLNDVAKIEVIDVEEYRTNDAKAKRDAAYAAGRIPLKTREYERVREMADAARAQLDAHEDAAEAFRPGCGTPEQTMIWQEGGVWCRARLDWLPDDRVSFYDFKTTGQVANPDTYARHLYDMGYDVQAALYRRGIARLLGVSEPSFCFVVQETAPPYCLSVIGLPPQAIDYAERQVDDALRTWAWCLENDEWPGYPSRTAYVEPPMWKIKAWEEREARVAFEREIGDFERALKWQAPLGVE